jgi:hypothetical protein
MFRLFIHLQATLVLKYKRQDFVGNCHLSFTIINVDSVPKRHLCHYTPQQVTIQASSRFLQSCFSLV